MIDFANTKDSQKIANLIKNSILACEADHHNDEAIIATWLANKTPENIVQWINNGIALTYSTNENVVGFFLVSHQGEILLNYVEPNYQGQGIGKALLSHAESVFKEKNIHSLNCESTITAKNFYLHNYFTINDEIIENGEIVAYSMTKNI